MPGELRMKSNKLLKATREQHGHTIREMVSMINMRVQNVTVTQSAYIAWESGNRNCTGIVAREIARILNVDIDSIWEAAGNVIARYVVNGVAKD